MAPKVSDLHFILFPFLAPGHMIPMIDIARLLAQHGVLVTLVTTPINGPRSETVVARAKQSGLRIQVIELRLPCKEAGLPEDCENLEIFSSRYLLFNLLKALEMLQLPLENLLKELKPSPSCMISDMCLPWTVSIASKFNIPRISFHGLCCFCLLLIHSLHSSKVHENISSDSERFVVPGLPDQVEVIYAELPEMLKKSKSFGDRVLAADTASYGVIVNTFEELEPAYVEEYKKASSGRVWCVGPVSLCNKGKIDKVERGNYKASTDGSECLKWLDSWKPSSVIYVCLGTLFRDSTLQLIELGLGLEGSMKPFIWVIKGGKKSNALEEWLLENNFEDRIKGRGLLIWGWAPQVLILSHPAIGGFLTHCGWNSTLEGISSGVPLVTWPHFGDQFFNEKLVVQLLKVGVRIGVEEPSLSDEDDNKVLVKKEDVEKAINILMNEGEVRDERRRRARELADIAKKAIEEGGSSYLNITLLIKDIMKQAQCGEQSNAQN